MLSLIRSPRGGAIGGALILLLALLSSPVYAQGTGSISGSVLDDQSEPLVAANIYLPELERGTTTDVDGDYEIDDIPAGVYEVRASFAGFQEQVIAVTVLAGQTVTQDFTLAPASIGEAIVEGYRIRRQAVESGAASVVNAEDIETLTIRSADAALQGRAAGVRVTSTSGQPGAGISVQVRGSASITAGTEPLYIVDGVQISNDNELNLASGNPLASISPNDIESIEVLKDPAAAAIYGAEASNGVVIVTTKRGREGSTQVEVTSQIGTVDRIDDFEVLNSEQFLQNRYESLINFFVLRRGLTREQALGPAASNAVALFGGEINEAGEYVPNADVNTVWQDQVFRSGLVQQYGLSARGGGDRTNFYVAGTFNNDEGQVIASQFRKYGLRVNLDHEISSRAAIQTAVNLANSEYRGTIGDGPFINSPFWAAQFIPPTASLFNTPGDESSGFNLRPNGTFSINPVAQETFDTRNANVTQIIGSAALNTELINGFLLSRTYAGVNHGDAQEENFRDPRLNVSVGGRLSVLASRTTEFNLSQAFTITPQIARNQTLSLLAGTEYRRGFEDDVNTRGSGFPSEAFQTLAGAATPEIANSTKSEYRRVSLFGNAEYTYDNTYQLASTLRYDGSSRFGFENRYGIFGTIAGFVRFTEAPYGAALRSVFNDLKLRASTGVTGNSNIGNFASRRLVGLSGEYAGGAGTAFTGLGNQFLTWEENWQTNVGLDYAVANNRIRGSVDVYNQDVQNLLLQRDVASDSGFGSLLENVGEIRLQGLELALNTVNVVLGDFRWSTNFNIAFERAEVLELVGDDDEIVLGGLVYREGEAPAQYRYARYAGVNPANGRPMYLDADGNITYNPDTVDDGVLLGNDDPDFYGGFGNTFSYGGLSLDVFFQYDYGRVTLNNNAYFSDVDFNFNKATRVLDRWQQPGDITAVPAPIFNGTYRDGTSNFLFTERFIEDASYIRLKQIRLGYTVPTRFFPSASLRTATLYLQAENLLTFTNYTDTDPELVGTALGQYPQSRRLTVGVRLGL